MQPLYPQSYTTRADQLGLLCVIKFFIFKSKGVALVFKQRKPVEKGSEKMRTIDRRIFTNSMEEACEGLKLAGYNIEDLKRGSSLPLPIKQFNGNLPLFIEIVKSISETRPIIAIFKNGKQMFIPKGESEKDILKRAPVRLVTSLVPPKESDLKYAFFIKQVAGLLRKGWKINICQDYNADRRQKKQLDISKPFTEGKVKAGIQAIKRHLGHTCQIGGYRDSARIRQRK